MKKTIEADNITFKYDERVILKKLKFFIEEKSFLSIIGPNGSGKSTLLKIMGRNLVPDSGDIIFCDKDLKDYTAKELAQEMAVVPQSTEVNYNFTVEDIVLMGRHPHLRRFQKEGSEDFAIAKQAMELTNTWHLRDRFINEISGGERQRVIISRALAQEPKVILLDEPTSALDIHHQIEVLDLLKYLNRDKGVTIIAVLHDLNLAARYSKEILLLHQGHMITMGKAEEVITVDNLKKAYDIDMIVDRNIYTGDLQVLPISSKEGIKKRKTKDKTLHIICGGGVGKYLIQFLWDEGYNMSMGVVNKGDSDWELGKLLSIPMVEENPFCDITETAFKKADLLATEGDITILTSIPLGRGNFKNLMLAKKQLERGKKVYLYNTYDEDQQFDYTDGKATELFKELKTMGLEVIVSKEELLKKIEG